MYRNEKIYISTSWLGLSISLQRCPWQSGSVLPTVATAGLAAWPAGAPPSRSMFSVLAFFPSPISPSRRA